MRHFLAALLLVGLSFSVNLKAQVAIVSAAGFQANRPFAPNEIAAAFGDNLAGGTEKAPVPLPTILAGTTVTVVDSAGASLAAQLFFVSNGQVNFLIPGAAALGPATVTFRNADGLEQSVQIVIAAVSPGLFALNPQGLAAAFILRVAADGAQTVEDVFGVSPAGTVFAQLIPPAADGEQLFILLFGSGFRDHSGLETIALEVGGFATPTLFAGDQGGFAGLDQLNAGPLSPLLSGRSGAEIYLKIGQAHANFPTVTFGGRIAAMRPDIIRAAPNVLRRGETLAKFELRGRNMASASGVAFEPPEDLLATQTSQSDAALVFGLRIGEEAALGPRMVSVPSPDGRSKWAPIDVIDLDPDAPIISNLNLSANVSPLLGLIINLGLDWRDANRDIRWTGALPGSAFLELDLTAGDLTCGFLLSGFPLDLSGETSGRFLFSGPTGRRDLAKAGTGTLSMVLVDSGGNRSNVRSGPVLAAPICEPGAERQTLLFP